MVAVAAVVAVAVTLAVRHLTADRVGVGFVTSGSTSGSLTDLASVRLPIGTVEVRSGDPVERVEAEGGSGLDAERGAQIVPIAWTFGVDLTGTEAAPYPSDFSISLTAGDETYDLGETEPDLGSGDLDDLLVGDTVLAVVPEDGDLTLGVTYDGETQAVDLDTGAIDPGRAAPLYDGSPTGLLTDDRCDPAPGDRLARLTPAETSGNLSCDLESVTRTPYLPYLGWAAQGETWTEVVLRVTSSGDVRWLGTDARYRVRRGEPTFGLAGAELADLTCSAPRGTQTCTAVLSGTRDTDIVTLRVDAPMTAVRTTGSGGPDLIRFGVHQTFDLTLTHHHHLPTTDSKEPR